MIEFWGEGWPAPRNANSSIQSKFSITNRWAMKSLIACQNEASRGLSSASRLTALSSSSRAARCAARFVPTGVRKSRILSSVVGSLFASNSDDRARDRKASMHVSRRVLMTMLNAHTPLGVHYTALVQTARWKRGNTPNAMTDPQLEGHMASHIGRRKFLATLGGVAAMWPLWAWAQQDGRGRRITRIAALMSMAADDPEAQPRVAAFESGLRELGWLDGRNLQIEYRWVSDGDLLRRNAAELARMLPDLILATSTPVMAVLREQGLSVPIMFVQVTDPVGQGLVPNLARPGGHITGFTNFEFS